MRSIVFLVDSSASMDEELGGRRKIDMVCEAIFRILSDERLLLKDDRVGLMFFHATKSGDVPKVDVAIPFSSPEDVKEDLDRFMKRVKSVKPIGGTPIGFGLSSAIDALSREVAKEKKVILVTDGENNVGVNPEEVALDAKGRGVRVDVVGIGDEINMLELINVADRAGGEFRHAFSGDQINRALIEFVERPVVVEKPTEIPEEDELSRLVRELTDLRGEAKEVNTALTRGRLSVEEYSERLSELEFREREMVSRIRDLRSELSRKLMSAQISMESLQKSAQTHGRPEDHAKLEELESYIGRLRKLLEISEIE